MSVCNFESSNIILYMHAAMHEEKQPCAEEEDLQRRNNVSINFLCCYRDFVRLWSCKKSKALRIRIVFHENYVIKFVFIWSVLDFIFHYTMYSMYVWMDRKDGRSKDALSDVAMRCAWSQIYLGLDGSLLGSGWW